MCCSSSLYSVGVQLQLVSLSSCIRTIEHVYIEGSVEKADEHFNSPKRSNVKNSKCFCCIKAEFQQFMLLTVEIQPFSLGKLRMKTLS